MKSKLLIPVLAVSALALGACETTDQNVAGKPQKFLQPAPDTGSHLRRVYTADNPPTSDARTMNMDNARSGGGITRQDATGATSRGL